MKKITSLVIIFMLLFNFSSVYTLADTKDVNVYIDGVKINFDVKPIIDNGRTLVPIRAISEYLKYEVSWNNEKQEAEIENHGNIMVIGVNRTKYTKNGEEKELDVPAKLINGRTLVPVRLISESFGCEVDWDNETFSVYIKTQPVEEEIPVEKVWTPDFSDFSGGSINNPLKPGIVYVDHKYASQGKGVEYLEYQPTEVSEVKKIRINSVKSYTNSEIDYYVKDYVNIEENKEWKCYMFHINYMEGTSDLNLTELLSVNNILNSNGKKFTDEVFIVYNGQKYDENSELIVPATKAKYIVDLFIAIDDVFDINSVLKISYDSGNDENFMYINPNKQGYDGTNVSTIYESSTNVDNSNTTIPSAGNSEKSMTLQSLKNERAKLVSELNSALASNMGRESSYTKAIRDKIKNIDEEISRLK